MKRSRGMLMKIAAVSSSLLLGGGYIAFQAGVLPLPANWGSHSPMRLISSSKSARVSLPMATASAQPAEPKREVLMFSSKSEPVVTPANETAGFVDRATAAPDPVLISGSKSAIVLTPEQLRRFTISGTTVPSAPGSINLVATQPTTQP
jgi:hypothetical protein